MKLAEFLDDRCRRYAKQPNYRRTLDRERPTAGQKHRMRSGRG
jgi:hypothetical protein